jgi:prophage antirepressor-like protein
LDEDEKLTQKIFGSGQNRKMWLVSESGLYALIMRSNKSQAKHFRKWVTAEVIPSIRKHGGYLTAEKTQELIANPDLIIQLAQSVKEERQKRIDAENSARLNKEIINLQEKVISEVQPKVQYYENVMAANDGILTNIIAKELGMSAVTLNRILSEKKVIYKQGESWILYSRYQDLGYTKTRTYTYVNQEGQTKTSIQTLWTQKGREFIHNLICQ